MYETSLSIFPRTAGFSPGATIPSRSTIQGSPWIREVGSNAVSHELSSPKSPSVTVGRVGRTELPPVQNKTVKNKNRRGHGHKTKNKVKKFKIIGNNANGIESKKQSFKNLIKNEEPTCFVLQETKCKRVGQLRVEGYQIFEVVRQNNKNLNKHK